MLADRTHVLGGPDSTLVNQYLDSWSHHVESWLSVTAFPLLVIRYEDLKTKPFETFGGLIKFLGWEFEEDRLSRATRFTDIRVLQRCEADQGILGSQ
jgi:aryl sulfotransferase